MYKVEVCPRAQSDLFESELPKGLMVVSGSEFTQDSRTAFLTKICLDILLEI